MAVLRVVEGVTGVKDFGTEGNHREQFGVQLYVRVQPDSARQKIRVACAHDKPTKLDAALVARQRVAAELGPAALEAADTAARRSQKQVQNSTKMVMKPQNFLRGAAAPHPNKRLRGLPPP